MIMKIIKYSVIEKQGEFTVRVEDGGVAYIYNNGEHMLTEYFQDRCTKPEPDWDTLSEGKMYTKDWEGKQETTYLMIEDALNWLYASTEDTEFEKVDKLIFNK